MKPTIIRGTKLQKGGTVFYLSTGVPDYVISNPGAFHKDDNGYGASIQKRTVAATNGESFAFARKSFRWDAKSGPWAWIEQPEDYFVTIEEAQVALDSFRASYLNRARKLLAKAIAEQAEHHVENMREQVAALEAGTHPALFPPGFDAKAYVAGATS